MNEIYCIGNQIASSDGIFNSASVDGCDYGWALKYQYPVYTFSEVFWVYFNDIKECRLWEMLWCHYNTVQHRHLPVIYWHYTRELPFHQ